MEIRRIEGIIPVEGINRDLPLKVENFSYYEMKKLLSQITAGEQKGNPASEFETLLKAVFLEYEGENRGRFKLGNSEFTARLEVNRTFQPGEEVLLRLKSIGDRIEFSLVLPVRGKLSEILKGELVSILNGNLQLPDQEILRLLIPIVEKLYPELSSGFRSFAVSGKTYSPYTLLSLLLLMKPDVREEIERKGVKPPGNEELKSLINQLLGLYSLYALAGIVEIPVNTGENFRGKVLYRSLKEELSQAFMEIETGLGNFKSLVKLLGKNVSVEYWASQKLLNRIDREEIRNRLISVGLNPVLIRAVSETETEEFRKSFFKGEGISINLSV